VQALQARILERYPWPQALDIAPSETGPSPSADDLAAAERLLASALVQRAGVLRPGKAALRREQASITGLEAAAELSSSGLLVVGPIASDLYYLPPNGGEAYPYARVRETFELTERPRRLAPILLDYHAFIAGSPGGLATLDYLYRWIAAQQPYWLGLEAYRARVEAFREQVVARHLDGRVSYHGGEALRTVRMPYALGTLDLGASSGVAVLQTAEQAQYVSFGPGHDRSLAFATDPSSPASGSSEWPHLTNTNGEVQAFRVLVEGGSRRIEFEIAGPLALQVAFGGLGGGARCHVRLGAGPRQGTALEGAANAAGQWEFSLEQRETGPSRLVCLLPGEGPG
jgi:polysaccharide biosynthesis protein PelA